MTQYTELVAIWGITGLPASTTGTGLAPGDTAQQKINKINTWMKLTGGAADRALLPPSDVINAIVPADMTVMLVATTNALFQTNQLRLSMLQLLLSGTSIDASSGTIRTVFQTIFSDQTNKVNNQSTLQRLLALVDPYDNQRQAWWRLVGFESPVTLGDAITAGLS